MESPFTTAEFLAALEQGRVNSAPVKDDITWAMIRNLPKAERLSVLKAINGWWTKGHLSNELTDAVVILISNPPELSSLRLVSLMPILCKLMKIMCQ